MQIVALEEHLVTPGIAAAWRDLDPADRDLAASHVNGGDTEDLLLDLSQARIAAMNEAGVDVQVLSISTPGVQTMEPARGIALAREANDRIATAVRLHPDRFQGFATLPMSAPKEAARELERAVVELGLQGAMLFGRVRDRNLDHPDFYPVLETAARLRAPLHLHPQTPALAVREAYYRGLGEEVDDVLATAGIGWHYETGVQALRLVLSGTLEKLPDLRLILGHWGEAILFYLERIDLLTPAARLPRPVSDYVRQQIWVTPSGMLSHRYLRWAIEVIGIDRIMFATDHPFVPLEQGAARQFIEDAQLSLPDRGKLASGNWSRLISEIRR